MVYLLPVFLLIIPVIGCAAFAPFLLEGKNAHANLFMLLTTLLPFLLMVLLMPFMLVLSIILPAAELHLVDRDEFAAAFRVREWWQIFRANWGGFLLALAIAYAVNFLTSMLLQIAMISLVLICALPVLLPALSMYMMLVMEVAFAQAYKQGKIQLGVDTAPAVLSKSI